jgi:hypothetical protein
VFGRARTGRVALPGFLCAALTAVLAGCGGSDEGSNGVGGLPAPKIVAKARAAAERADAVRLSGDVAGKGRAYRIHMRLKRGGGTGKVSVRGGSSFGLLRIGEDLYLKADAGFWARHQKSSQPSRSSKSSKKPSKPDGGGAAAGKLHGKYVKVPHGDPAYEELRGLTDMRALLAGLLSTQGKRRTEGHGEVDGTKSVSVRAGGSDGGSMAVAVDGEPYPLRVERGAGAGTVELSDWGEDFTLHAPDRSHVVDYGKEIAGSGD